MNNNNNNHHCNSRLYHSPSLNMNPHNNNYNGLTYTHSYINNNTSPLEANDLQYHKHKPTFDYITDIKQIDEELLSPNTTQYTSSKRIQYTKQNNDIAHNKLNSSNYSLKIDDCSDIERNSSFVNKPLSLKSPSLSKLTTSKINKYFHNSLMNKLHYENSNIDRRTSSPFYGKTNNNYESIFSSKRKPQYNFTKPLSTEESKDGMNIRHHNVYRNNNNHMMIDDNDYNVLYCRTNEDSIQEENKYLKNVINSYKKLLDSLFYFVNSLSHKYSFNKPFYQMNHYINNEDELTKELLALDKCLQNNINVSLVEFQKQELLNKLVITQEVSVTLSAVFKEKENNDLYVYSGDNHYQDNNNNNTTHNNINSYHKESNRYKKNSGPTSMSSIRQNSKESKECVRSRCF